MAKNSKTIGSCPHSFLTQYLRSQTISDFRNVDWHIFRTELFAKNWDFLDNTSCDINVAAEQVNEYILDSVKAAGMRVKTVTVDSEPYWKYARKQGIETILKQIKALKRKIKKYQFHQ